MTRVLRPLNPVPTTDAGWAKLIARDQKLKRRRATRAGRKRGPKLTRKQRAQKRRAERLASSVPQATRED